MMSCVCCCTVCGESSRITRTSAIARAKEPVVSCIAVYVAVAATTGMGVFDVEVEVVFTGRSSGFPSSEYTGVESVFVILTVEMSIPDSLA